MRFVIHPVFYAYLLSIALLSSWTQSLAVCLALLIHEFGHYLVCKRMGEAVTQLELTPFGGVMRYSPGKTPSKGIRGCLIHASGPAANYLCLMLSDALGKLLNAPQFMHAWTMAHLSMLVINLLPVIPLDGGQIVFSIGYYLFPAAKLIQCLSYSGMLAGMSMVALALYGAFVLDVLNCSLILVGGYIAFCAMSSKTTMLAENMVAIIQDRESVLLKAKPLRAYLVPGARSAVSMLPLLSDLHRTAFLIQTDGGYRVISEDALCQALLKTQGKNMDQIAAENQEFRCFFENRSFSP